MHAALEYVQPSAQGSEELSLVFEGPAAPPSTGGESIEAGPVEVEAVGVKSAILILMMPLTAAVKEVVIRPSKLFTF